ncbi:MAG: ParB/RepB/Spo0J family partition protein [Lachnospiraceae bacterium]|nr:ParB/RepB/Spo0J family partition protein [Lachnospiraceae bacterium]
MTELVMVPTEQLEHHPDNPRKDLGDLRDLMESIKAQGILQNLTIMPKAKTGKKKYWVVIGNRRFEAAKTAGIKELPCRIVEMDEKEAMKTMMSENMQRSDLTVLDQVQGIVKMQQLGMSLPEISRGTGLSETTVRRRSAIGALPKKELETACDKGATLLDLLEITKLEDEEAQKKVLESIGTNNFQYSIANAVRSQSMKKWRDEFLPKLQAVYPKARKCKDQDRWSDTWETVHAWRFDDRNDPDPIPEPEEGIKYGIAADDIPWNISLLKIDEDAKKRKAEEKDNRDWMKQLKEEATKLNKEAAELRYSWIRKFIFRSAKERAEFWELAEEFLWRNKAFSGGYGSSSMSGQLVREIMAIPLEGYAERQERKAETFEIECERRGANMDAVLLAWAVSGGVCGGASYSVANYVSDYNGAHVESEELDKVYEFLTRLGYQMSDFEKSLQKGTHPFIKNPKKYFKDQGK